MRRFVQHITLGIILLLSSLVSFAQVTPVQVSPQLVPPYSLQVSEYYSGTIPKIQVLLINRDINQPTIQVKLKMTVESQNCRLRTKEVNTIPTITLTNGVPYYLAPSELQALFSSANLDFGGGLSEQQYNQTGRLPEGLYTFTFEAYELYSGNLVSNKGFSMGWLTLADPPLLNTPSKGEEVTPNSTQSIVFNWTPRHNTSPTAAYMTEYLFTLVEYNDAALSPEAAFVSSNPILQKTVTTTTMLFSNQEAITTNLVEGKRYAWRVQAKAKNGAVEIPMFRNNGISEVHWFVYKNSCTAPQGITVNVQGQRATIEWQNNPLHLEWKVEYREQNNPKAEWFTLSNTLPRVVIMDLKPSTNYEYRVGGACYVNQFTYSPLAFFSTANAPVPPVVNCGDSSYPVLGTAGLQTLNAGDTIRAGSFTVKVGYSTGSGSFTGTGYVIVPWLMNAKVEVKFTNITMSTDYKLVSGLIETTYDPTESGIDDIDEYVDIFKAGYGVGDVVTGEVTADKTVDFIVQWPNGINVTLPPNYNNQTGQGSGPITIVLTPQGGGAATTYTVDQLPTTIKDKDGNLYQVDKAGNISQIGQSGGSAILNNANKSGIDNDKALIKFVNHPEQRFALDVWQSQYAANSTINNEYQKLNYKTTSANAPDGHYYVPAKAIGPGQTDVIRAVLTNVDNSIIADSIKFISGKGVIFKKTKINETTFDISIVGGPAKDAQEIYAVYKESSTQTLNLGKILVASYPDVKYKVVLVPIGSPSGYNYPEISDSIVKIYNRINVNLEVNQVDNFTDNSWDLDSDGLDVKGSGAFSVYTTEMKLLNQTFAKSPNYDRNAFYIFVLSRAADSTVLGDMPRGKQFGYLFTENNTHIGSTAAHEVSHGLFRLKHIADYDGMTNSSIPDNLLAYPSGNKLSKFQWDYVCDPGFVLGIFEKDEDGQEVIVNNLKEIVEKYKNSDGTLTFLSMAGKPLSIKVDKLTQISFANEEDVWSVSQGNFPMGVISSFVYDGQKYKAVKETNTNNFLGYCTNPGNCTSTSYYVDTYSYAKAYTNTLAGILCIKKGIPIFKIFPTDYLDINTSEKNTQTQNKGEGQVKDQFFLTNYLKNEGNAIAVYGQIRDFKTEEEFFFDKYGSDETICGAEAMYFLSSVHFVRKNQALVNCIQLAEQETSSQLYAQIRNAEMMEHASQPAIDNTAYVRPQYLETERGYYYKDYQEKYPLLTSDENVYRTLNTILNEYNRSLLNNQTSYSDLEDEHIKRIIRIFDIPQSKGRSCLLINLPIELRKKILDKSGQWKFEFSQTKESLLNDVIQYTPDSDISKMLAYLEANNYSNYWRLYDEINASQSDRFVFLVSQMIYKIKAKPQDLQSPEGQTIEPYVEFRETNRMRIGKDGSKYWETGSQDFTCYSIRSGSNIEIGYSVTNYDKVRVLVPNTFIKRKFTGGPFDYVRIIVTSDFPFANINGEKIKEGIYYDVPAIWVYWLLDKEDTHQNFKFARLLLDGVAIAGSVLTANPGPFLIADGIVGGVDMVITLATDIAPDNTTMTQISEVWDVVAAAYGGVFITKTLVNNVKRFTINQAAIKNYADNLKNSLSGQALKDQLLAFSNKLEDIIKTFKSIEELKAGARNYTMSVLLSLQIRAKILLSTSLTKEGGYSLITKYNAVAIKNSASNEYGVMNVTLRESGDVYFTNLKLYKDEYGDIQRIVGATSEAEYHISNKVYNGDIVFVETSNKEIFALTQENFNTSIKVKGIANLPFLSYGGKLVKTTLGTDDLSQFAVNFRKTLPVPNHRGNVAVFEYIDINGTLTKKAFSTEINNSSHSEEIAIDFFNTQNIPKQNVRRIYSELEPCELSGHTCKAKLEANFPKAQKSFSYYYPGGVDNTIRQSSVSQRYLDLQTLLQ